MKTRLFVIVFLSIVTNIFGQKDTLYFDANWHVTAKDSASFYRPMPLEKVGDLYQVKDFYANGNRQMEGFWSDVENEILEGKSTWYYPTGVVMQVQHYRKGKRNGEALYYSKKGHLRAKGIYKDDAYFTGAFLDECCYNGYIPEYKEGKKVGHLLYHNDTEQIALKAVYENDSTISTDHFDREGKKIGNLIAINHYPKTGMQATYYLNDEDDVIGLEQYFFYENRKMNGAEALFNKDGKQLSKGKNREDKPYSGTFFRYNHVKTYVNGKLEGEEIGYSEKMEPITKGINKDDSPWEGQFIYQYSSEIKNYKNGMLEGKQTIYFSENFQKIKSYHHIVNNEKVGESGYYDIDGQELAKGIYKGGTEWDGTFFDVYENSLSSYEHGLKHGMFIQYDSNGTLLTQQEYENDKITAEVISQGYFQNKSCSCIYKSGAPITGQVCEELAIMHYKNGLIIKRENYAYDYDKEENIFESEFSYNTKGDEVARTVVKENKKYVLTLKDGQPYTGVQYTAYNDEIITYKNGKKEGPFNKLKNKNRDLIISGNYKNDVWHGVISFYETGLEQETTCTYKNGKPKMGTVIENHTFTSYKNGLKHGRSEEVLYDGEARKVLRAITYEKGIRLNETWPQQKNDKGEIIKGVYKNNEPFNGYFFEFEPAMGALSQYVNGVITGNQYVGYNDNESLVVLDSMNYKAGKPYQGKLIEHYDGNLHEQVYSNGKLLRTVVTDDYNRDRIKNTVTYTDDGFVINDKDSDMVLCDLSYTDEARNKGRLEFAPELDEFIGSLEFHNNKITAIDVRFNEGATKIAYDLVDGQLEVTIKTTGITLKAYPTLEHVKTFTYRNFLDLEKLLMGGKLVLHSYIDGRNVATSVRVDTDMHDGIHIWYSENSSTYMYIKMSEGKSLDRKDDLTKKDLLELLKK